MMGLFVAQLTATIVAFALKDRIIEDIINKTGAVEEGIRIITQFNSSRSTLI